VWTDKSFLESAARFQNWLFDVSEVASWVMTNRKLFVVSWCVFVILASAPRLFSQPCRLEIGEDSDSEVWLEGTVGDSHVRVYWSVEPDGELMGSLYDLNDWSVVLLEGSRGPSCGFRITEKRTTLSDAPQPERLWEGTLRNRVFSGIWRRSEETGAIRLQKVSPMDCDGRGKWIKFSSPQFPISFEYPDNWRIVETLTKNLRIMCPDPRAMQFSDSGVSIVLNDGENKLRQNGRFTRSEEDWLLSASEIGTSCDPSEALCMKARVSRQDGLTVVYGSGSTRVYEAGAGYSGIGEEEAYILLLTDRAVYVSSVFVNEKATARIVRSAKPIPARP